MKPIKVLLRVFVGTFTAFLRSQKCSLDFKRKDFEIKLEAPTVAQVERLLKCLDEIGICKNKRKKP
jgi:hypothetical protein